MPNKSEQHPDRRDVLAALGLGAIAGAVGERHTNKRVPVQETARPADGKEVQTSREYALARQEMYKLRGLLDADLMLPDGEKNDRYLIKLGEFLTRLQELSSNFEYLHSSGTNFHTVEAKTEPDSMIFNTRSLMQDCLRLLNETSKNPHYGDLVGDWATFKN